MCLRRVRWARRHARILIRHLLPNILQPVLVQATIAMAGAILAESTLSFLGLGVLAPMPSWGAMLNDARSHLFDAPHLVIFPGAGVMARCSRVQPAGRRAARLDGPSHARLPRRDRSQPLTPLKGAENYANLSFRGRCLP